MDKVDKKTRSRIMSSVGQKDTGPETLLRHALHKAGLRYRLHDRMLPGSPDLVFPRFGAVIFVHGCYWHSHGCYKSTLPKSRREFWDAKFRANRARDERNLTQLYEGGWRVMTVWECILKGKTSVPVREIAETVKLWLHSSEVIGETPGPSLEDTSHLHRVMQS